jgi:hypothetical protein
MLNMQAEIRLLLSIPDHPGMKCPVLLGRVAENEPLSVVEDAESKISARLTEEAREYYSIQHALRSGNPTVTMSNLPFAGTYAFNPESIYA